MTGSGDAERRVHAARQRVRLHARPDAERRKEPEDGEEHREPAGPQAAGDVVHGAADDLVALVAGAVGHRQRDLAVLDDHAPQARSATARRSPPGRPSPTASATPTILPVPSVAASAVHTAWNGEMAPCSSSALLGRWKSVMVVLRNHDVEAREDDAAGDDEQEHAPFRSSARPWGHPTARCCSAWRAWT